MNHSTTDDDAIELRLSPTAASMSLLCIFEAIEKSEFDRCILDYFAELGRRIADPLAAYVARTEQERGWVDGETPLGPTDVITDVQMRCCRAGAQWHKATVEEHRDRFTRFGGYEFRIRVFRHIASTPPGAPR